MNIKGLPRGDKYPEQFNLVIEMPKNSHNKYEYDEELDIIKIDRVFFTAMALPYDYGFIPKTRSEDGDHLDGIVILDAPVYPGIMVNCRPIGVAYMVDSGEKDEKIISVCADDVRYNHIKDLSDLSEHFVKELEHYFIHYKDLQNKKVEITKWGGYEDALQVMKDSIED